MHPENRSSSRRMTQLGLRALMLGSLAWAALAPSAQAQTSYPPRYQVFTPPANVGAQANSGEINVGFNPITKRYMAMAFISGDVLRITPPERRTPALPESCEALWENKTPLATSQPQAVGDPIMFTDGTTGRTWASNFTAGANYSYAYTTDDGENWTNAGVSPPNGGADHQTIASGPYPAGSPFAQVAAANGFPNAVYFCSQAVAPNFCQRSDDGGRSYGPGNVFTPGTACGGLHGHARVAKNGDVFVPDKSCGSAKPGFSVSSDAGVTWKDVVVTPLSTGSEDPSIGIANDGTLYFCNVNADGRVLVSVSKNKGATWINTTDIGSAFGIKNAVFTNAIAGDSNRAACGFIGTTVAGVKDGLDFTGIWYPYIAHTYDGGLTWTTVSISPNDPVQGKGGICRAGTTCMNTPDNRNLLDFNEITIDDNGRPAYAYDDGCTGACVDNPLNNSFTAEMKIARQYGGRTLFASKDASYPEPAVPNQSCLAGTRTIAKSALKWNPPDNGGLAISGYKIFRSTTPGVFSNLPIATTANANPAFDDVSQDPDVPTYYYRITALNSLGEGNFSNEVALLLSQPENVCAAPGVTTLTDPANDIFSGIGPEQGNQPFYDVRSLSISQPYFANGTYKLAFHIRMTSLATLPPNATWPVNFCAPAFANCTDPNVAVSATNKYFTVRMTTPMGTPVYEVLKPIASGITRTTIVAEPESTFTPAGLITIVVKASDIGLTPAGAGTELLSKFLVRINAGGVTPDNMPDSLVGSGFHATRKLSFCGPNIEPVARLTATPSSGSPPLVVTLSGADSTDADLDDSIASYTFDFGDGSQTVTQTGASVTHTYASGEYNATLKVRDSRGKAGLAPATVRVSVAVPNTAPTAAFTATPQSGVAPLAVHFDAGGSSDSDANDRVASYTFDYGDGSPAQTGTAPGFDHTYTAVGRYTARLTVKDTRDTVSVNLAERVIEVVGSTGTLVPFTFIERTNVPGNTFISSETVTLSGFTGSLPLSVSEGLQYSINGGPFSNVSTMVPANSTLVVRHISATAAGAARETMITVGGYTTVFRTVTAAASAIDRVPDAFFFDSQSNLVGGTVVESNIITLANYDEANAVAGPGVMYRINGGTWTSGTSRMLRNDTLQVRQTTNSASLGYTKGYVTVGGVRGTFTTRTRK